MAGCPAVVVECRNTFVTPGTDAFVGRQTVGIEQLADETGGTAVQTVHVAVAIGTAVAGYRHGGITLVE